MRRFVIPMLRHQREIFGQHNEFARIGGSFVHESFG
jgi:hypothetical protein